LKAVADNETASPSRTWLRNVVAMSEQIYRPNGPAGVNMSMSSMMVAVNCRIGETHIERH